MNFWQVWSTTGRIVRTRFWSLLGLYVVWFAIELSVTGFVAGVGMVGLFAAAGSTVSVDIDGMIAGGAFAAVMAVAYLAMFLTICAQYGSMCAAASPLRSSDFVGALGVGLRSGAPILCAMLLLMVAFVALIIALGTGVAFVANAGTAATIAAALLALVALAWLGARTCLVIPIIAVDRVNNPFRALARAWSISRGDTFPLILVLLTFTIAAVVLFVSATIPFIGSFATLAGENNPENVATAIGAIGGLYLVMLAMGVLVAVVQVALLAAIHALFAGPGAHPDVQAETN